MALVQWCCGASYFLLCQDYCGYVLVSSLLSVLVRSYTLGFAKGVGFLGGRRYHRYDSCDNAVDFLDPCCCCLALKV